MQEYCETLICSSQASSLSKHSGHQHRLYDSVCALFRSWPELDDLESSPLQQILELALCSLHACVEGHHSHIEHGIKSRGSSLRDNHLMQQKFRIAGLHGWLELCQHLQAYFIGPVVEDMVEEVCSCACKRECVSGEQVIMGGARAEGDGIVLLTGCSVKKSYSMSSIAGST